MLGSRRNLIGAGYDEAASDLHFDAKHAGNTMYLKRENDGAVVATSLYQF